MTPFDITTATPQQVVDRVAERLRDGRGRCAGGSGGACLYYREKDGNMCAVGYLLPDPKALTGVAASVWLLCSGDGYEGTLGAPVIVALRQHLPLLLQLQLQLHDANSNWTGLDHTKGVLSRTGEAVFAQICTSHGLVYPEKKETADAEVRS